MGKTLIEELRSNAAGHQLDADLGVMTKAADAIEEQAATIALYETTAENYELLQAKVDEQAWEIERLEAEVEDVLVDWGRVRLELAALKAQPSGVVLDQYDAGLLNDFGGGNIEWWQDYIRAELERAHDFYQSQLARLNSSPVSAGDDESRHETVKALHDVMQAVPCASLYSLAEAVLDAGYVKPVSAGGVDERATPVPAGWLRFDDNQRAIFTRSKRGKDAQPLYPHPTSYRVQNAAALTAPSPGECVAVSRELLERLVDMLVNPIHYNPGSIDKRADELRALLAQHGKAVGDE